MRVVLLISFFLAFLQSGAQDTAGIHRYGSGGVLVKRTMVSNAYMLGSDSLRCYRTIVAGGSPSVIFLNVHDDENTATESALLVIDSIGGELLELKHAGTRNLHFRINGNEHRVDPNRIYTLVGIRASLRAFQCFTPDAYNEVQMFADTLISGYLASKTLVVALHNNTEGGLSIKSYLKGGTEVKNAGQVYINPAMDIDDFVLTTRADVFRHLKQQRVNVVLQHKNPVDDGSFSVFAAQNKVGYINVEAQHGHFEEQSAMLFALHIFLINR